MPGARGADRCRRARHGVARPPRRSIALQAPFLDVRRAPIARTSRLRADGARAGGHRPRLAARERRLHADGEDHLPQLTRRSRDSRVRLPAADHGRRAVGTRALVWVHEDIRGHLYEHHIPYIREAVARGYIVIAPEYRGSIGYGRTFYDAIDYGGAEVDDVVTAVSVLKSQYPVGRTRSDRHHRVEPRRPHHAARRSSGIRRRSARRRRWCRSPTCSTGSRARGSTSSGAPSTRRTGSVAGRRSGRMSTAIGRRCSTWTNCASRCWSTWRTTTKT